MADADLGATAVSIGKSGGKRTFQTERAAGIKIVESGKTDSVRVPTMCHCQYHLHYGPVSPSICIYPGLQVSLWQCQDSSPGLYEAKIYAFSVLPVTQM